MKKLLATLAISLPSLMLVAAVLIGAGPAPIPPGNIQTGTGCGSIPLTSGNNTWCAGNAVGPVSLTFGATVTPNAALSNNFTMTATAPFTLANPTNLKAGQTINIWITQDATGGRVMTTGTQYQAPGSSSTLALSTTGGSKDLLTCQSDTASTMTCSVLTGIIH